MALHLLTFGGLGLESGDASPAPRLRPQRLAILAVLAAASERGVSRERMLGLFWPDSGEDRARNSLRQALYVLRQELGGDAVRASANLSLDRGVVDSDVGEFRRAIAVGDAARAASVVNGPFLDGFYLAGASGFDRWVEEERAALGDAAGRAILSLAREAESRRDYDAAAGWWRRLTRLDPLSGRYALGFLRTLAAGGDRAGALAFARAHESVVRRELESDADPAIRKLEAELRAMPAPVDVRTSPPATVPRAASAFAAGSTGQAPGSGAAEGTRTTTSVRRLPRTVIAMFTLMGVVTGVATFASGKWAASLLTRGSTGPPTLAVGMVLEEGVPDTLRIGGVITDMLATNLARMGGVPVLANSRLFELLRPGQDTLSAGYLDAARRAGATEILQGRLLPGPQWGLGLELQRIDLASGIVRGAYRVTAPDRYALVDSMTSAIARDLRLGAPPGSVADATTDSPVAYRLYEEGLRAYYQYDEAAARRLMNAALEQDSTFAMAAYYDARMSRIGDGDEMPRRARALRLAARAPERERLTITADILGMNVEPGALAVAESLTMRFPRYPRAHALLSSIRGSNGDWAGAVAAIERAVSIDSAAEPIDRQSCALCDDLTHLANVYLWWDSLPAAERTAQRYLRLRPRAHYPWHILAGAAAARGDSAALETYLRRFHETNPAGVTIDYFARRYILGELYHEADRRLGELLLSPRPTENGPARWLKAILLRNEGRFSEALRVIRQGTPDVLANGLITMETGNARAAVALLAPLARSAESSSVPGVRARNITWFKTLYGMTLAAAGDTAALARLADTVEYWGTRSLYGRDRRAHHYVRGMLRIAEGRDAEAAEELRQAIHSPAHGFTRVNYELGRALVRLGRPDEAVSTVRAALHGDIDGSNLYITRTELHELLGRAFDRLQMIDSAAVHYRAAVRAWARADAPYQERRAELVAWLSRHAPRALTHGGGTH
jgi:DNA-binding SARP family transcriptional activator